MKKEARGGAEVAVDALPPAKFDAESGALVQDAASRARDMGLRPGLRVQCTRKARGIEKGEEGIVHGFQKDNVLVTWGDTQEATPFAAGNLHPVSDDVEKARAEAASAAALAEKKRVADLPDGFKWETSAMASAKADLSMWVHCVLQHLVVT
eukprot:5155987-Alexandrium_andersonii.AAC.1